MDVSHSHEEWRSVDPEMKDFRWIFEMDCSQSTWMIELTHLFGFHDTL
jgi:hypothetical protein